MAQYPTAAGTDANLFLAVNNLSCSLSDNPLTSGATTINVSSTTGFPTTGFVTIDAECIQYTGTTGTTFTGCTRGASGTTAASHVTASQVLHTVVADHHNVLKDEIKAIEGDLVGVMASITPASPANTATSLLNRWAQLAQQLKNIAGTTNWYDSITKNLTQLLPLSGGTLTGAVTLGADCPAAGFKFTGLGAGSAAGHSVRFEQLRIIQVVSATDAQATTTTSVTYVDTTLAATIVPTSASNKILIIVQGELSTNSTTTNLSSLATIARGTTNLSSDELIAAKVMVSSAVANNIANGMMFFLDAPATTSSTVYKVRIRSTNASNTAGWNTATTTASIVLLEVAP